MSIKTITLAFAAGLLASQAYARLQQGGAPDGMTPDGNSDHDDDFDDQPVGGNGSYSLSGDERLNAESLGSGVLGESPDEAAEPYRADDAELFGSDTSNSDRSGRPGMPDLTRSA